MSDEPERPSVGDVLARSAAVLEAAGTDSPRLDAELLLADAFGFDRTRLFARLDHLVPREVAARFDEMVGRRQRREPAAYIRGRKEFMSLEFAVTPSVMIPRPETETLVERALGLLGRLDRDGTVMDLCTGSGCIGISLAVYGRKCRVYASDIDGGALEVARRNAARAGVEGRIVFLEGDLYSAFDRDGMAGTFDLVVANPPYVTDAEWFTLWPETSEHEPRHALAAGEKGYEMVDRVIEGAPMWLRAGGTLLVEMAEPMVRRAQQLAESTGLLEEAREVCTIGGRACGMEARRRRGTASGTAQPLRCGCAQNERAYGDSVPHGQPGRERGAGRGTVAGNVRRLTKRRQSEHRRVV